MKDENTQRNFGEIRSSLNKNFCPACGSPLSEREVKLKKCKHCGCTINFTSKFSLVLGFIVIGALPVVLILDKEFRNCIIAFLLVGFILNCISGGFHFFINWMRDIVQWFLGTGKYRNGEDRRKKF